MKKLNYNYYYYTTNNSVNCFNSAYISCLSDDKNYKNSGLLFGHIIILLSVIWKGNPLEFAAN